MLQELGSLVVAGGFASLTGSPPSLRFGRPDGKPDNLVALIPTIGRSPERVMGSGIAGTVYHQPSVQVYVRRVDPEEAWSVAVTLHNMFDNFSGEILGVRYFLIECAQYPFTLGIDENRRAQFLFNIHVRREPVP
jgi:hypothetical protein